MKKLAILLTIMGLTIMGFAYGSGYFATGNEFEETIEAFNAAQVDGNTYATIRYDIEDQPYISVICNGVEINAYYECDELMGSI